jgi:hypothetical protein
VNHDDAHPDPLPAAAEVTNPHASARQAGGVLRLVFKHPSTAIKHLYEQTAPRLFVDGKEQPVNAWTEHRVPVAVGIHQVRVFVPFESARFGESQREVVVDDADVVLEYVAPAVPATAGRLRTPQEATADDARDVTFAGRAVIVLAVVILVSIIATWSLR